MRTPAEIDDIVRRTQAELDQAGVNGGISLHIPRDGYAEDGAWLNIVVEPDQAGVRAHEFVDVLGEVEKRLRAAGVQQVLLVPALAE